MPCQKKFYKIIGSILFAFPLYWSQPMKFNGHHLVEPLGKFFVVVRHFDSSYFREGDNTTYWGGRTLVYPVTIVNVLLLWLPKNYFWLFHFHLLTSGPDIKGMKRLLGLCVVSQPSIPRKGTGSISTTRNIKKTITPRLTVTVATTQINGKVI